MSFINITTIGLTGEFTAAAELVEKALTLVRTRDDALDIRQVKDASFTANVD